MGCKINANTVSKILTSLTDFLDSLYRGKVVRIRNFQVESGCNELDNFLSSVYKVKVAVKVFGIKNGENNIDKQTGSHSGGEDHEFNLICKTTILEDEGKGDNLEKYYWNILFTKEKIVYDFLQNLSHELGVELGPLCPKMHHCYNEGEDYSCIVLDDLVSEGYYMPDSLDPPLSLEECKLIMQSLARLHALSLVVEGKEDSLLPEKFEMTTAELLFSSGVEPALKPITYNSFQGFLKLTEKFRPDLFPHLKKIDDDENIWNRLCNLVKAGTTSFSCLNHGDPRLNNIFIRKSNPAGKTPFPTSSNSDQKSQGNGLEEGPSLRFIDFQLTRYSSPVTDLQYALHMGTTRAFRQSHTDTLLETYFAEFKAVLGLFPGVRLKQKEAVESWTLEKLKLEYEELYMYGLLVSLILLPMILLRPGDIDKSMSQMTKDERNQFFVEGRADLVLNIGSKNDIMRERLFELCDEMIEKKVI